MEDLLRLGFPREDLVAMRPTPETVQNIKDTLTLISDAGPGACMDARLLTILRFWGEVLVSSASCPRRKSRHTGDDVRWRCPSLHDGVELAFPGQGDGMGLSTDSVGR